MIKPLNTFRKRYASIQVSLINGTSDASKKAVIQGDADVALSGIHTQEEAELIHRSFLNYRDVALIPDNRELSSKKQITAHQLVQENLLLLEKKTTTRQRIDRWFRDKQKVAKNIMSLGSVDAQLALFKAGFGIAIVPDFAVPKSMKSKPLVSLGEVKINLVLSGLKPATKLGCVAWRD